MSVKWENTALVCVFSSFTSFYFKSMKEAINLCTALREVSKKVFVLLCVAFFNVWPQASCGSGRAPGLQGLQHRAGS